MKQTLTIILLMIAVQQANAGGFYGMVTAGIPAAVIGSPAFESGLSPLYDRVLESSRRIAEDETGNPVTDWSFTPLYLRATGSPQKDTRKPFVTGGIGDHSDS